MASLIYVAYLMDIDSSVNGYSVAYLIFRCLATVSVLYSRFSLGMT